MRTMKQIDESVYVYGHGGVRVYRVTREEAQQINKASKSKFKLADGNEFFYINIAKGKNRLLLPVNFAESEPKLEQSSAPLSET
jgi:hypothetical protein